MVRHLGLPWEMEMIFYYQLLTLATLDSICINLEMIYRLILIVIGNCGSLPRIKFPIIPGIVQF